MALLRSLFIIKIFNSYFNLISSSIAIIFAQSSKYLSSLIPKLFSSRRYLSRKANYQRATDKHGLTGFYTVDTPLSPARLIHHRWEQKAIVKWPQQVLRPGPFVSMHSGRRWRSGRLCTRRLLQSPECSKWKSVPSKRPYQRPHHFAQPNVCSHLQNGDSVILFLVSYRVFVYAPVLST